MKLVIWISACFLTGNFLFAQDPPTPAEVLKVMEKSDLSYNLSELEGEITCPDQSKNTISEHYVLLTAENGTSLGIQSIREDAKVEFDKAENFFSSGNWDSTVYYYQKALEKDPSVSYIMTYLGQMYGQKKLYSEAVVWYELAIKTNPLDFMAHWFLADTYWIMGKTELAVNEITLAWILNRNNPRIKISFFNIMKSAGYSEQDFDFCPQYTLEGNETEVDLKFHPAWAGYAMVKALWKFEPGYSESKGVKRGLYSSQEEKEAMANLVAQLQSSPDLIPTNPAFSCLMAAAETGHFSDFYLFETMMKVSPVISCTLPEDVLESLKNYILKVRQKKK